MADVFPEGRRYVYTVRCQGEAVIEGIYVDSKTAHNSANALAKRTLMPHDVDVYEESFDRLRFVYAATRLMKTDLGWEEWQTVQR